jgi:hypothetical protein
MKKIATYLILLIAVSASSTTIYGQRHGQGNGQGYGQGNSQGYGQGYGQDYGHNDDMYDNPYDQSQPDPRYNQYPPQRGGNCQQSSPRVVINTRPIVINPYAVNYCPPPAVSYCRPVVINPYPVYPVYRRGYAYHHRRHGYHYRRGWR